MSDFTLYSYSLFAIATVCFIVVGKASNHIQQPITVWFIGLTLAYGIGAGAYGMELTSHSIEEAQHWIDVEITFAAFIPSCILLMSLTYQKVRQAPVWQIIPLILISILLAIFQNIDVYHLVPLRVTGIRYEAGLSISQLSLNNIYYIYSFYIHLVVVASLIFFYYQWKNCSQSLKPQIILIMLGTSSTWLCYLIFLSGVGLDGLDVVSFGYGFSAIAFAFGIYRYQFIELIPIARTHIFEQLSDAYLIMDNSGRIIDYNDASIKLFSNLSSMKYGITLYDVSNITESELNRSPKLIQLFNLRWYEVSQKPIVNKSKQLLGTVVHFLDVTEREQILAKLRTQAETDSLTGFSCRSHILKRMHELIDAARKNNRTISAAIINIANLEKINEEQGNSIADIRIKQLARTIQGIISPEVLIGRLSGGKFLLLFPSQSEAGTETIIEEIIAKCEKQLLISLCFATAELKPNEQCKSLLQRLSVALIYSASKNSKPIQCEILKEDNPSPLTSF